MALLSITLDFFQSGTANKRINWLRRLCRTDITSISHNNSINNSWHAHELSASSVVWQMRHILNCVNCPTDVRPELAVVPFHLFPFYPYFAEGVCVTPGEHDEDRVFITWGWVHFFFLFHNFVFSYFCHKFVLHPEWRVLIFIQTFYIFVCWFSVKRSFPSFFHTVHYFAEDCCPTYSAAVISQAHNGSQCSHRWVPVFSSGPLPTGPPITWRQAVLLRSLWAANTD